MSADNWGLCPSCINQAKKRIEELKQDPMKVDDDRWEEYHSLKEKLNKRWDYDDGFQTLREDYELGVDEECLMYIRYSAYCENCGFGKDFSHQESPESGSD